MPAKDLFHDVVRSALEKDGWTITADPQILTTSHSGDRSIDTLTQWQALLEKTLQYYAELPYPYPEVQTYVVQ